MADETGTDKTGTDKTGKRNRVNFAGMEPGPNPNEIFRYPSGAPVSNSIATWDLTPNIVPEEHFADDGYLKHLLGYFSKVKEVIGKIINDRLHEVPAKRFAQSQAAVIKSDAVTDDQ